MNANRIASVLAVVVGVCLPFAAGAQKYGGTLLGLLTGNPPSLSLHDEAPTNANLAMAPVYSNLVLYDPLKPIESYETIIPELAASFAWSAGGTELAFKLRHDVKWHDDKPFTSGDVKNTFDIVRGASTRRLKLNPRKIWYANVAEIVTKGDYEVAFKLKRPQPALIAMLSTLNSPVMPGHVPPLAWRAGAAGTGPFMLKDYQRDRAVFLVKNPAYFVPGRPYLDAVEYHVIPARASQLAAFVAGKIHIASPTATTKPFTDALKATTSALEFTEMPTTVSIYILFNTRKAPFNNPKLRRAISLALDRNALIKAVFQGAVVPAGTLLPPPVGTWGLSPERLASLPGYGSDTAKSKAEAQEIMRSLGYSKEKPLQTEILTSSIAYYSDMASWSASVLRDVYLNATVRLQDPGVFYGSLARREFSVIVYTAGNAVDDPDPTFYEHYSCASYRNYADYCNPDLEILFGEQSQMFDKAKRLEVVHRIDETLVSDVARVLFGFRINYSTRWPFVKNFIPHQAPYNHHRLQDVWLDK